MSKSIKVGCHIHEDGAKALQECADTGIMFKGKISEVVHRAVIKYLEAEGYLTKAGRTISNPDEQVAVENNDLL